MTTNIFEAFDDQSQTTLSYLDQNNNFLDLNKGFKNNNPFENITSRRSFEEITFDNKFGNQIEKCGAYNNDFYIGALNIRSLIDVLKTNADTNSFFFHYLQYTENLPIEKMILTNPYSTPTSIDVKKTIPFEYIDSSNKNKIAKLVIKLNTRACHVNLKNPGFVWNLNTKEKEFYTTLHFAYSDAVNKRDYDITPKIDNDFTLEEKYEGIIIKTENFEDLLAVAKAINKEAYVNNKIRELFINLINTTKDNSELVYLYEIIPNFIINDLQKGIEIKQELLFEHLNKITDYDDIGFFSGFKDSSSAFINILKLIGNSEYLYSKFVDNPVFIKRIYKNLDGYSLYEGQNISNKIIFSQLLAALCATNGNKGLNQREETFYYGQGYKFNADVISLFSNEKDDEFYLQQLKEVSKIVRKTYPDDLPRYSERIEVEEKSFESVDKGAMYHPLDLVYLVDTSVSDKISFPIPAIVIKALSDEKEIQEIEKGIRIGFDILAIVIGAVVVATTGNPLIATLAIADIALATTDIGVLAIREQLLNTEGGKEFLESWEKIYIAGSIVTAGPAIFNTLFKVGNGILKGGTVLLEGGYKLALVATKNANIANFVRSCMLKVLLEINIANFTKNTVKDILFAEEALAGNSIKFDLAGVSRLQSEGVIFIKGIGFDNKSIGLAVIYKGEAIASGTAKEVRAALKEVWTAKSAKLIEILEEILEKSKFLKVLPKNCEIIFKDGSYIFKDLATKELVGLVEIKNNYLEFAIYRLGLKTKITGQQTFNSLIAYLKYKKIEYRGIRGLWSTSSDNTKAFNNAILKDGYSNEKAAFKTWTGERALEQGFDKVQIDKLLPLNNPPYTSISVTFYK